MIPGELLDPSPEQALSEHLAKNPGDESARLALITLLTNRGQLEMARSLIETAPGDGTTLRARHDTLRARIEKAPNVSPRPAKIRWSAVRVIFLSLILLAAVGSLVFVPGLLVEAERRVRVNRAIARLSDPDMTVRLEAARMLMSLGDDPELFQRAVNAIDLPSLDEPHALFALGLLRGHDNEVARGLEHSSLNVRLTAANALHDTWVNDNDRLVRAARKERALALILMDPIVYRGRPEDVAFILDAARSNDRELKMTTLRAIARTLERLPNRRFPELQAEVARVLREDDAEASAIVLQGGLAAGSDEALAITLAKLRGRSMLGGRQIETEARKFLHYTREQLMSAYTNENDANARLVLARALRDKK